VSPCHPALARLDAGVCALRVWSSSSCACSNASSSSSSSGHGLALLEAAIAALGDMLATPRAAAALRGADGHWTLDGLLVLADTYGSFGPALLAARQGVADAWAGTRRGEYAMVAASARAPAGGEGAAPPRRRNATRVVEARRAWLDGRQGGQRGGGGGRGRGRGIGGRLLGVRCHGCYVVAAHGGWLSHGRRLRTSGWRGWASRRWQGKLRRGWRRPYWRG